MTSDDTDLVDRLWQGEANLATWSAAVSGGAGRAVADDVLVVSTGYLYGTVSAVRTDRGLVLIDTGSRETAAQSLAAVRRWDRSPVHAVVYTHGHIDHSWGARLLDQEADAHGWPRPHIIAHRNVLARFRRYDDTKDLNSIVMGRQFNKADYSFPTDHRRPDEVYDDSYRLSIGDLDFELVHGRGETDDATFVWLPKRRVLFSGDFVIWACPNAGNPRKVQRHAPDWAAALHKMRALDPDILVPGHGPAVTGADKVAQMLEDGAALLDSLVGQTVALMNQGRSLNEILHRVQPPKLLLAKPYLLPTYDDPEFIVRGIWHLYAGWYGGDPASLKPAPEAEVAAEIAACAGGPWPLARSAQALAAAGRLRVAAHLIGFAAASAPTDQAIQALRADIYARCAEAEPSLIGKAIFAAAQREASGHSLA